MSRKRIMIVLVAIMALGAFLRFHWIADFPLGLYPDEAMNGNNALEALATGDFKVFYPENNGREGLYINLQAVSVWLFGNKAWALRIVSALFGTLTILGVYLVARELFAGKKSETWNTKYPPGRHSEPRPVGAKNPGRRPPPHQMLHFPFAEPALEARSGPKGSA